MPVTVSSEETLKPFLKHLQSDGSYQDGEAGKEEYYETEMGEWEIGILYKDGRMDLCKMWRNPLINSHGNTNISSGSLVLRTLLP